jgi:hypothetical protein
MAGSSRLQVMPSILRGNRVTPINAGPPPAILGKNLPPEVYKFIQQVARIQACGYPRPDGPPLLFKEDYTPVPADIPKELYDLTVAVLNQSGQNKGQVPPTPPPPPPPPPAIPASLSPSISLTPIPNILRRT